MTWKFYLTNGKESLIYESSVNRNVFRFAFDESNILKIGDSICVFYNKKACFKIKKID